MKKSKVTLIGSILLTSTAVTIAYAGFTEINSSGDIISKDNRASIRTSFSSPEININTPPRTYTLWDKISETTKYNATIKEEVVNTPLAIETVNYNLPNITSKPNANSNAPTNYNNVQTELNNTLNLLKQSEDYNNKLKFENLEMQVKVIEMNKNIAELQKKVNFLASQMEQVESDVLVMKTKKNVGFLARN